MYDLLKLLHLIAAIVWMGGMIFMVTALRPATLAVMDVQPRAVLMAAVWRRFFVVVFIAIVVLLTTGGYLFGGTMKAAREATGHGVVPLGWTVMTALGGLMFLIFGHIYFAGFAKFRRAVAASEWPAAAQAAGQIHKLMIANMVLGYAAIAAVKLLA